jgi:hypothetical protein
LSLNMSSNGIRFTRESVKDYVRTLDSLFDVPSNVKYIPSHDMLRVITSC